MGNEERAAFFRETPPAFCKTSEHTHLAEGEETRRERVDMKEQWMERRKGKKPMTQKEKRDEPCWLNRPAFLTLQKELPKEFLYRFYHNIEKD